MSKEIKIYFYKAGGPGGQRKNKRETAVRAVHIPTGLTAVSADYRYQSENRQLALERLGAKLRTRSAVKKKRKKTFLPSYAREERLRLKKLNSNKKEKRGRVSAED